MGALALAKTEVLVLGAVLAAFEGAQVNVAMSTQAHSVVTMAITMMSGAGIQAIGGSSFVAALPAHLAALISSLLGGLVVLTSTLSLSSGWQTVIAVVVVVATALGVGPTTTPGPRGAVK